MASQDFFLYAAHDPTVATATATATPSPTDTHVPYVPGPLLTTNQIIALSSALVGVVLCAVFGVSLRLLYRHGFHKRKATPLPLDADVSDSLDAYEERRQRRWWDAFRALGGSGSSRHGNSRRHAVRVGDVMYVHTASTPRSRSKSRVDRYDTVSSSQRRSLPPGADSDSERRRSPVGSVTGRRRSRATSASSNIDSPLAGGFDGVSGGTSSRVVNPLALPRLGAVVIDPSEGADTSAAASAARSVGASGGQGRSRSRDSVGVPVTSTRTPASTTNGQLFDLRIADLARAAELDAITSRLLVMTDKSGGWNAKTKWLRPDPVAAFAVSGKLGGLLQAASRPMATGAFDDNLANAGKANCAYDVDDAFRALYTGHSVRAEPGVSFREGAEPRDIRCRATT